MKRLMGKGWRRAVLVATAWLGLSGAAALAADDATNPTPTAADWAALAKLPDWSGVWTPDTKQPNQPFAGKSVPPWNPAAAAYIAQQQVLDKAGKPNNFYVDCLPEGLPSVMIMTLNTAEFLFTPGRVTYLNEFDGNRLRRIYTDGRGHPADPDLTFNGHSIGHWEGDTLVVDTVALLSEDYIPIVQSVGIPNNGGMHVVEHIHLAGPDRLEDDLDIDAPKVLTDHWRISKFYVRSRKRSDDILEASCRQGDFVEQVDKDGNHFFVPTQQQAGGVRLPVATR